MAVTPDIEKCANCGHAKSLHFPWCTNPYIPGKCNYQYDLCGCTDYQPKKSV